MSDLYTYVIGGMFQSETRKDRLEFHLIKPSGSKYPYYTNNRNSSILRVGNQNNAIYMLDLKEGVLRKQPDSHYEIGKTQPDVVTLTGKLLEQVSDLKTNGVYID